MSHPQTRPPATTTSRGARAGRPAGPDECRPFAERERDAARGDCSDAPGAPAAHGIPGAQTRAWSAEQIAARQPDGLARAAAVREIDRDARTVELSFSSEEPVRRFFGDEILSHAEGAMRTQRLAAAAPLLVNHDWDDQIGVVDAGGVRDKKGRATVRFSQSARGAEIFQDVVDGIRKNVSVGYAIHGVSVEERDGQPDRVTVTDWEPMEISIAAVAADISVGVGRTPENPPEASRAGGADTGRRQTDADSANHGERRPMKTKILRNDNGDLVRAKVDDNDAIVETLETLERAGQAEAHAKRSGQQSGEKAGREAEQQRTKALLDMGAQYGARDLAQSAVADGTAVDAFQRVLLDHLSGDADSGGGTPASPGAAARAKPIGERAPDVGLSEREVGRFSFLNVARAIHDPSNKRAQDDAAFEREVSEAAQDQMPRETRGGWIVPREVLQRALNTGTGGASAGDTGGEVVDNPLLASSFIELLRNRTVAMRLGRPLAGLVGNPDIPRQTSGTSGYWIGEDEAAGEDTLALGHISLRPKTVAGLREITRRELMQSSVDMEALVRSDLAEALALAADTAFFYGSGSDNQPLGIANTNGINAVEFAGALPGYQEIVAMESEIAADNADVNAMAYVFNSRARGHFKTTEKFAGASGATVWEPGNTVNGYTAEVTNQIQQGDVIFGNFADCLIGMWGGLELSRDPYTHSAKGRLRLVAMQDMDFVLRRAESFCLGRQAAAG